MPTPPQHRQNPCKKKQRHKHVVITDDYERAWEEEMEERKKFQPHYTRPLHAEKEKAQEHGKARGGVPRDIGIHVSRRMRREG